MALVSSWSLMSSSGMWDTAAGQAGKGGGAKLGWRRSAPRRTSARPAWLVLPPQRPDSKLGMLAPALGVAQHGVQSWEGQVLL